MVRAKPVFLGSTEDFPSNLCTVPTISVCSSDLPVTFILLTSRTEYSLLIELEPVRHPQAAAVAHPVEAAPLLAVKLLPYRIMARDDKAP